MVALVEEVQERERALGVFHPGLPELRENHRTEHGAGRRVLRFDLVQVRRRLLAGVTQLHVVFRRGRILLPERFHERLLSLVIGGAGPWLCWRVGGSPGPSRWSLCRS